MKLKVLAPAIVLVLLSVFAGCGPKVEAVAEVNGEPIPRAEWEKLVERSRAQVAAQGLKMDAEQEKALKENALEELIRRKLLEQEAKAKGVTVSDAEVGTLLEKYKAQFPAGELEKALKEQNLTLDDLKADIRYYALADKLYQEVTKDVNVDEADLEKFYAQHRDSLRQVKVRHILFDTKNGEARARAAAQEVLRRLKKGEDFAALAREYSADEATRENGGLFPDYFTPQDDVFGPEFVEAAFALSEGEVTEQPVRTSYGYHLIKVEDKKDSLDEVKADLEEFLLASRRDAAFSDYMEKARQRAEVVKKIVL